MERETKYCPYCGEEILAVAKKCRYCGEWLDKVQDQAQEPVERPVPEAVQKPAQESVPSEAHQSDDNAPDANGSCTSEDSSAHETQDPPCVDAEETSEPSIKFIEASIDEEEMVGELSKNEEGYEQEGEDFDSDTSDTDDPSSKQTLWSQNTPLNEDDYNEYDTEEHFSLEKHEKGIIVVVFIVALLVIIFAILRCTSESSSSSSNTQGTETPTSVETQQNVYSSESTEPILTDASNDETNGVEGEVEGDGEADMFSFNNPWSIDYIHNEWGDNVSSYITATLKGSGWNMRIDYLPGDVQTPDGVFRFSIVNEEGYLQDMDGPAQIFVRVNGKTFQVDVIGVKGSLAFVEDSESVKALKLLFNHGQLDILMNFEKYNERHRCQATFDSTEGYFNRAVNTLL